MARPSKLTMSQCAKAVLLHSEQKVPVRKLAAKFGVSESSMYKVIDGSYHARPDEPKRNVRTVQPSRPEGVTPSVFEKRRATDRFNNPLKDIDISKFAVDDVTLAAAQLIVSRSRFAQALREA